MNSNQHESNEVHVVTEMDVYEATIRQSVRNLESPTDSTSESNQYSWSDIEEHEPIRPFPKHEVRHEQPKREQPTREEQHEEPTQVNVEVNQVSVEPVVEVEPSVEVKQTVVNVEPVVEEKHVSVEPVVEEKQEPIVVHLNRTEMNAWGFRDPTAVEKETMRDLVEQMMTEIVKQSIRSVTRIISESVKEDDVMDTDDDMPELVDSNTQLPPLVRQSDNEESEQEEQIQQEEPEVKIREDVMIAIFNQPECPRCAAVLNLIMSHQELKLCDEEKSNESATDDTSTEYSSTDESTTDDSTTDDAVTDDSSDEESTTDEEEEVKSKSVIPAIIVEVFLLLLTVYMVKGVLMITDATPPFRGCPF